MSQTESPTNILRARADRIAQATSDRHFTRYPDLGDRLGPGGRDACTRDAVRHLDHLATAVDVQQPVVFTEYVLWARSVLTGIGLPSSELVAHLRSLAEAIVAELPEHALLLAGVVDQGITALEEPAAEPPRFSGSGPHGDLAVRYLDLVLAGDRTGVVAAVTEAVETGTSVEALYVHVFQPVLRDIGRLWQLNQITVAQEHFATAATQLAMSTLYPRIFADRGPAVAHLLATCVGGELHEVGIRMVADIFELRGWSTHFIGANVPLPDLLAAAGDQTPDAIAISATLPTHVDAVARTIVALRENGVDVPILVGGRPFLSLPSLVRHVGADATAPDAVEAVSVASTLVGIAP